MKKVSLSGSLRENVGKKDAKKSREKGFVPCVVYGGKEQIHFTLEEKDFKKLIFTPETYFIELDIDGKQTRTILKDIQYHPVTDRVMHADFLEIFPDKPVDVGVPIILEGSSPGVLKGGILIKQLRKLRIKGLPDDIPEKIRVNIDELEIGNSIKVSDISIETLQLTDPGNQLIVAVKTARSIIAEEEEEGKEGVEGEEGAEGGEAAPENEGGDS